MVTDDQLWVPITNEASLKHIIEMFSMTNSDGCALFSVPSDAANAPVAALLAAGSRAAGGRAIFVYKGCRFNPRALANRGSKGKRQDGCGRQEHNHRHTYPPLKQGYLGDALDQEEQMISKR